MLFSSSNDSNSPSKGVSQGSQALHLSQPEPALGALKASKSSSSCLERQSRHVNFVQLSTRSCCASSTAIIAPINRDAAFAGEGFNAMAQSYHDAADPSRKLRNAFSEDFVQMIKSMAEERCFGATAVQRLELRVLHPTSAALSKRPEMGIRSFPASHLVLPLFIFQDCHSLSLQTSSIPRKSIFSFSDLPVL